jgi:uncharacterized protein with NRDE domain
VHLGKKRLAKLIIKTEVTPDEAFSLLADTTLAPDAELPDTGVPFRWEKALSAAFISLPDYGTRCSTFLKFNADHSCQFIERRFTGNPQQWEESEFCWTASGTLLDRKNPTNKNSMSSSRQKEKGPRD